MSAELRPGRKRVALQRGYSQLDWMRLTQTTSSLTGLTGPPPRLTLAEVRKHNSPDDAWMVIRGKVYNVTPYFNYHPGGIDELMRGAGIDATALFDEVHRWVNIELMLAKACIGELIVDPPTTVAVSSTVTTTNSTPISTDSKEGDGKTVLSLDDWTQCTISAMSNANEAENMLSITISLPTGMIVGWQDPIQHVDLSFISDITGVEIVRPYTPVSQLLPDSTEFELLVKVYPSGKMSGHLSQLKIGDVINVKPNHSFVHVSPTVITWAHKTASPNTLIFIAGGSGITPILQMVRYYAVATSRPKMYVVYSVRSLTEIPLHSEITALFESLGVVFHVFVTDPLALSGDASSTNTHPGRITTSALTTILPTPTADTVVMWSGPMGFGVAVDSMCRSMYYLATNFIALDN